ncbi:MAG: acyl-CoA/acyl-ACP dehydrogenase [Deltaproteobacteria bacterium]|nr:acyl-CoA/acyl-ACP dehydrogenase [Deltaproteobacteria bacterium]
MSSRLHPSQARESLPALGRLLFDVEPKTLWERDTQTLDRRYRKLRTRYRDFAAQYLAPRELHADRGVTDDENIQLFLAAARQGFQSEFLPKPLGTGSLNALLGGVLWPAVLKCEEFAAADAGLGLGLLSHDLGAAPLVLSGDPKAIGMLRDIYKEIAAGEPAIVAFAITEPGAGSDVEDTDGAAQARIVTRATKVDGGYRINGQKCFITGGRVARWVTLFAALENRGVESWTCFLLDRSMPGFTVGRSERKMGQRATDASELLLEDVFVPDERVVGGLESGWALNRSTLNLSRPGIGAVCVGIARSAFEHAVTFCRTAKLGTRPLLSYQDVQLSLAEMLTKIQAARALVWHTARYGTPSGATGAIPKAFASRVAWEVSTEAMELLGDHGTLHARGVEKAARDARLTLIYEGTHQMNLLAVVEGQAEAELG